MKIFCAVALAILAAALVAGPALARDTTTREPAAAENRELGQKPGQPLGIPADQFKQRPSDLAPETDPRWDQFQQQQQQRIEQGKSPEDPYYEPPTVIREETTRYEIVDDAKKKKKPANRWSE